MIIDKNKSYYISGIKKFCDSNNPVTYIYIKDSFNKEESKLPFLIKVKDRCNYIDYFSKIYLGDIKAIDVVKDKSGNQTILIEVNKVEYDTTSLMYEDYYELTADDPDIWYSPVNL